MFNPIRAFKIRGAFNCILKNREAIPAGGVITHSSGNHGQALAYAGYKLGIRATIVVPENAPKVKVNAMKKWGATLVFCKSTIKDREETCAAIQEKEGQFLIPPYDHPDIIEGQATAAEEAFAVQDFDAVIAPVGGGGLLAGSTLAAKAINPKVQVFGAEPQMASDAYHGFLSGERVTESVPKTMADGLRTTVGVHNFEIIKKHVSDIWLCSENQIFSWGQTLLADYNLLVEPSAATVLAALEHNKEKLTGKKVLAILSGGNVAADFYSANEYAI